VTYFLAVLAAGMLGTGFVLQQRAAQRAPQGSFLRLRLLAVLLRDRGWLAGLLTMIGGQLLSAWVLGHLVLSVAEPLLAANLLFALLLAWPMSGERLTNSEVAGALILVAGVAALSRARSLPSAAVTVGSRANWPLAALGAGAACYGFAAMARRRTGDLRATLTGASAGVVAGLQDALTRRVVCGLAPGSASGSRRAMARDGPRATRITPATSAAGRPGGPRQHAEQGPARRRRRRSAIATGAAPVLAHKTGRWWRWWWWPGSR
jgi:hypothetical protein